MQFEYTDEQALFSDDSVQAQYKEELSKEAIAVLDSFTIREMNKSLYGITVPDDIWKEAFSANPGDPQEYLVEHHPEWAI